MAKHHKHHYRKRNPFGFDKDTIITAAEGIVGGVASLALPAAFLPAQNSGFMGYGLNILSAIALKFVGNMGSKHLGDSLFAGGLVATGIRVVKDTMPSINLGAYWPSYFSVPTVSNSIGQTLTSPYPSPVPIAAKGMGRSDRFAARF